MLDVPGERVAARLQPAAVRHVEEPLFVVRIVPSTVLPIGAQAVTDPDFIVGRHADVALVEEGMELFGQEESILEVITARPERGKRSERPVLAGGAIRRRYFRPWRAMATLNASSATMPAGIS